MSDKVPAFMQGIEPLCKRGIATVACVRGNAAAGGVALATACDVVLAGRGVVLNPSYRGMGLHGSELHSYVFPHVIPNQCLCFYIFSDSRLYQLFLPPAMWTYPCSGDFT